jgi:hypothetical protein
MSHHIFIIFWGFGSWLFLYVVLYVFTNISVEYVASIVRVEYRIDMSLRLHGTTVQKATIWTHIVVKISNLNFNGIALNSNYVGLILVYVIMITNLGWWLNEEFCMKHFLYIEKFEDRERQRLCSLPWRMLEVGKSLGLIENGLFYYQSNCSKSLFHELYSTVRVSGSQPSRPVSENFQSLWRLCLILNIPTEFFVVLISSSRKIL